MPDLYPTWGVRTVDRTRMPLRDTATTLVAGINAASQHTVNWEAIGAVGEIAGAVGVIITLAYLSVQIRSSSRATESQVHVSLSSEMERVLVAASQDDSLAEAMVSVQRGEELTEVQRMKLYLWFGGLLRVCESHIIQLKLDATKIRIDKPISAILRQLGQMAFFREQMRRGVQEGISSDEFLEWLDSEVLADVPE